MSWTTPTRRCSSQPLLCNTRWPKAELTPATLAKDSRSCWDRRRPAVQPAVQPRHPARLVHHLSTSSGFRLCSPSALIKKQSAAGDAALRALLCRMQREEVHRFQKSLLQPGAQSQLALFRLPLDEISYKTIIRFSSIAQSFVFFNLKNTDGCADF